MKCKNCGFENEPNQEYCIQCGNMLNDANINQYPEENIPNQNVMGYPASQIDQPSQPGVPEGSMDQTGPASDFPGQTGPPAETPPLAGQMPGYQPVSGQGSGYPPQSSQPTSYPPPSGQPSDYQPRGGTPDQTYSTGSGGYSQNGYAYSAPQSQPPPQKKKRRLGLIIGLSAVVVILAVLALLLFPRRLSYESEDDPTTISANLAEYNIEIKSNQGIRDTFYALNPNDPQNLNSYRSVEGEGGFFKKSIQLKDLALIPGNNTLYLYTKTLFGNSKPEKIVLTRHVGYSARFEDDARQELNQDTAIIGNELIVILNEDAARSDAESIAAKYGAEIVGEMPLLNEYQLRFSDPNIDLNALQDSISAEPEVELVIFNLLHKFEGSSYPNDSLLDSWDENNPEGNNWGLEVMRVSQAYAEDPGFANVKAGVIDGSIQYDHEDLQVPLENVYIHPSPNIRNMEDLVRYRAKGTNEPGENYMGLLEHGTHVAGTIGAITNNGLGVAGVNRDCELYFFHYWHFIMDPATREIVYYEDRSPEISTFEFHVSIATLASQGCRVINFSIGSVNPSTPEDCPWEGPDAQGYGEICSRLEQAGFDFLFCKSAGNETDDAARYSFNRTLVGTDAGRRHTLIVASIENTPVATGSFNDTPYPAVAGYQLSYFSNYGEMVDVAAPGSDIFSTFPYDVYDNLSGTSMASPNAAGVASLIYAANPGYTSEQVKTFLMNETDTFSPDFDGRAIPVVNAAMAIKADAEENNLVKANVLDADTREPIAQFKVVATGAENPPISDNFTNGKFSMTVPADSYSFTFSAEGYSDEQITQFTAPGDGSTIDLPEVLMKSGSAVGTISGQVVNAVDGSGLADVMLTFYTADDTKIGEANVDADGNYLIDLPQGSYKMIGQKEGFIENEMEVNSVANTETENQNLILSPNITSDQARFVLSWGEEPWDLDLHIKGPGVGDDPYGHVYWFNKYYPSSYDDLMYELDVDDTGSYGPETITLLKEQSGDYIVYVHDYSNALYDTSDELGKSGAKITAYTANGVQTFEVPNQPGTLWKVLKYSNGVITPINEMLYEVFESDVPTR